MTLIETDIEAAYAAWDDLNLDAVEDGTVVMFDVHRPGADHPYTYVGLFVAGAWYLTGNVCHGVTTEDFLAWLIEHQVNPHRIETLS